MTTTPKTTITYSLEDILERIEDKIEARFEKVDRQLTYILHQNSCSKLWQQLTEVGVQKIAKVDVIARLEKKGNKEQHQEKVSEEQKQKLDPNQVV